MIEIVILWVYYTIPFGLSFFWHFWHYFSTTYNYFIWLRVTDEGSVPEMRIWSILLIKSDLEWCIHLSRSLFLYFNEVLQEQIDKAPQHDTFILMGDFNANVGYDNAGYESCMGKEGVGVRNNNGQLFADMCLENGLFIRGTIFQHKNIHKLTWNSPDGRSCNQIDHICINKKWKGSMRDVKAIRGAEIGSDHYLMLCKLKLKQKKATKEKMEPLYNSRKLKDLRVKNQFVMELNTRLQVLAYHINALCDNIHSVFLDTSENVLGYRRQERKEWISDTTWQIIGKRKAAKQGMLRWSVEQRAQASETYREKNREV